MTDSSMRTRTLGATLVRRLRMRLPADPMQRRAQEVFVMLQLMIAPLTLVQAIIVMLAEGWRTPALQVRITANVWLSLIALTSFFVFSWRGRMLGAARLGAVGMLGFVLMFAASFGLRGTPTVYVMTLSMIAVLALVERPYVLVLWTISLGAAMTYGLLATPRWVFEPAPITVVSSLGLTLAFFAVYLVQFHDAMLGAVEEARVQTDTLERTNADLRRTIDERDRLSAQLATALRLEAMGRMAGSIAHDFNNLLTVIRGYADLIADDMPATSPHSADVALLLRAVDRASNVTRNVLDLATPHPIALDPTDVSDLVRDQTPNLRRLLSPRVSLEVSLPDTPCVAAVDRGQLERLLLNLAMNAREVTPPGGTVRLLVACHGDRVQCRITDGGPGVPLSMRDRVFEPFFSTKGTTGGTGLGLASSFAIARQHGGTITVDDAPGGGAAFTLELPRLTAGHAAIGDASAQAAPPSDAGRPISGLSVLLVEDDEALRRLAMRQLERAGASVCAFDNGVEAVAWLQELARFREPLHLVVTDLRLPRGSGSEVIAAARVVSPQVAIVAISGFLDDPMVAERAAKHELSFLPKPFSEIQLLEAIDVARRYAASP